MIFACTPFQLKWIWYRNWMMTVHCQQPVALERERSQCHIFNICWLVFRWDKATSNILCHTIITLRCTLLDMHLIFMKKLIFYVFVCVFIKNVLYTFISWSFPTTSFFMFIWCSVFFVEEEEAHDYDLIFFLWVLVFIYSLSENPHPLTHDINLHSFCFSFWFPSLFFWIWFFRNEFGLFVVSWLY